MFLLPRLQQNLSNQANKNAVIFANSFSHHWFQSFSKIVQILTFRYLVLLWCHRINLSYCCRREISVLLWPHCNGLLAQVSATALQGVKLWLSKVKVSRGVLVSYAKKKITSFTNIFAFILQQLQYIFIPYVRNFENLCILIFIVKHIDWGSRTCKRMTKAFI